MKKTNIIMGVLLGAVLLASVGYERGVAEGESQIQPAKIAVVAMSTLLEKNKKNTEWQEKASAEATRINDELEALADEIRAIEAAMKTRKPGSSDHVKQKFEFMQKRAEIEAKDRFYQDDFQRKQKDWAEAMFQEVLSVVAKVAKEKGLDMVVAKEEYQFPSASANELILTIKTSKILYHAEYMDITADVLIALDESK